MGNVSKVIIVILAVAVIFGLGSFLMGSHDDTSTVEDGINPVYNDYELHYEKVKPVSSVIELTKTESKSSSYGFFDSYTGEYAEPAYSRFVSEYVMINIDISKMKLSNDSYIDDSSDKDTKDGNIYNQSHFKKDLKKILKKNKYPGYITLYDKKGNSIATIDDVKVSLNGNILTAEYSYTNTSEYYTEYERNNYLSTKFNGDDFAMNDNFHNVKKAKLNIYGSVDDRDSNRTVIIDIGTKNMKVTSSVSTNFKSTYDN